MTLTPKTIGRGNSGTQIGTSDASPPNSKKDRNIGLLKRPRIKFLNSKNRGLGCFSFFIAGFIHTRIKQK
jgi:hypothetical protein